MLLIRASLVLLIAPVCASAAQTAPRSVSATTVLWTPPAIGWPQALPKPTVPKEMIGGLRLAGMPIILEETKLKDVQKRFGGFLGNHGDAGDSLAWLCYFGGDASGDWIFWVTSGEMNGLTWIDGFQWRRLSVHERPDHRCRSLPSGGGGIQLPIPLHLGNSEEEVRQILGHPTFSRGDVHFFEHEHPVVLKRENCTVSNYVAVVIHDGSAWEIESSEITSN